MKRLMVIASVLVIGIFAVTVSGTAMAEGKKCPVDTVVSKTVDTTKKVGNAAYDTVGKVSDTSTTATKDVTGAAGDAVKAVSDTTVTAAKDVTDMTGNAVEAVGNLPEKAVEESMK